MGFFNKITALGRKGKILNELNDAQKKPVKNYSGASVIIAGPRAGKTKTLVSRTAYMIEDGIDPRSILLFTFTRKGANEIKERISSYIGDKAAGVTVGTYHSFCLRLLKNYHLLIDREKNFTIFDDDDKKAELKKICPKDFEVQVLANEISHYKDNMISPMMAMNLADNSYKKKIAEIYNAYAKSLKVQNAMDFDDIIYFAVRLLENYPEVQKKINQRYVYIMADEAQDSSPRDIKLIELLGGENFNVCVIGDEDQTIYSFRGSNIGALFNFVKQHDMKIFVLGQNYRSTKTIVNASRSMIKKNDVLFQKEIFSDNEVGEKIEVCSASNQDFEANQIVAQVKKALREGAKPHDIAVLYRMNYLSRKIEDAFLKNSIPYKILSGVSFYNRKEVKDLICYLRFITNDTDRSALERIINTPKRNLGKNTVEKIIENYIVEKHDGLTSVLKNLKLNGKQKDSMLNFVTIIELCREMLDTFSPDKILTEIINQTKYYEYLQNEFKEDAQERISNVKELLEIACEYKTVSDFIDNIMVNDENVEINNSEKSDKVSLLTMHASKGLEFPIVIIAGAAEGIIPSSKSVMEGNLQEERRLMYVALTRAKKKIFVSYPQMTFNRGIPMPVKPSRFLSEINKEFVKQV